MEIVEAIERSQIVLSISKVMDASGRFTFVPDVQKKGYFDVDYRQNELVLVAGKFIGQIPLTENLTIHVRPKVPISNLARLISIANAPVHTLEFFRRSYAVSTESVESIQEGMAKAFVNSLKILNSEGVFRQYKEYREITSSPKGKIDIGDYLKISLAKGKPSFVPCQYYLLNSDTTYNRLIKLALLMIGNSLCSMKKKNVALIREIQYFYDLFPRVSLESVNSLVEKVRNDLERIRMPDLRYYYMEILDIALLIVQRGSVEISSNSDDIKMNSFILNMEDTFEKYLREVMVDSKELKAINIRVSDGNTDARGKLFFDNSIYDAKPDFVISSPSGCIIGDAKYKTKASEADRYQVITHSLAFDSQVAFIVVPVNNGEKSGPFLVGTINRARPIRLYEYKFDLNSSKLVEEEERFCKWILEHQC